MSAKSVRHGSNMALQGMPIGLACEEWITATGQRRRAKKKKEGGRMEGAREEVVLGVECQSKNKGRRWFIEEERGRERQRREQRKKTRM